MIFLNRRRTPLKQEPAKDTSKYWYIEKYVYGVLKETVEVALGTGTKFTAVESGYDDDTFYGWSIGSTNTTSTFNATSTYKNTAASVKKYLDSENTIKLYAVYKYNIIELKSLISRSGKENYNGIECEYATISNCTLSFSGYTENNGSSASGSIHSFNELSFTVTYTDSSGKHKTEFFSATHGSSIEKTFPANSHIKFKLLNQYTSSSTYSVQSISYASISTTNGKNNLYDCNNFAYRVISHT